MGENNQRTITVSKEKCDKNNLYTINSIEAIDSAAKLQATAGFKLYMYLAKNQDKYQFKLSSQAFKNWSGCARTAYTTAFKQLEEEGYLVKKEGTSNVYTFYDKPHLPDDSVIIEMPVEKTKAIQEAQKTMEGFVF